MKPGPTHPRTLSVGGPGGIQIEGSNIQIGGLPQVGSNMPAQPASPVAPIVRIDLARAPALLVAHAGVLAAAVSVSAASLFVGAAVVISVFQLPWLLLAAPGTLSAGLVGLAAALVARARSRIRTGGVDPEVERRILDLAVACGGRLTVTAVARALSVPMAEADSSLSALAKSGHVAVENDLASGVVVYVFPDIDAGLVPIRRSP